MREDERIYSVGTLTQAIKTQLEGKFPFVWVKGQVTNVSRPNSGHLYFSLKDDEAALAAVWFKQVHGKAERFDPMTGEVFENGPRLSVAENLRNGQELLCAGRLSVYPPRGTYQLFVEFAEELGTGVLHAQFAHLRNVLQQRGFFSQERKRPIPAFPATIALITSPKGAAIHDFLRLVQGRGQGGTILLYPVPVQGEAAPEAIVQAISAACSDGRSELIVLIRGGGSLEDLWAFNDQRVAEAVYASSLPVLAGIGHEVDFTLADLTADLRAATPSHAAQLVWQERDVLLGQVAVLQEKMEKAWSVRLRRLAEQFVSFDNALRWYSPQRKLAACRHQLGDYWGRLFAVCRRRLGEADEDLRTQGLALRRSLAHKMPFFEEELLFYQMALPRSFKHGLERRAGFLDRFRHGLSRAGVFLPQKEIVLHSDYARLYRSVGAGLSAKTHALAQLLLRLEALDPYAPLERGYALVRSADARYLRGIAQVSPGEHLSVVLIDGEAIVVVRQVQARQSGKKMFP